MYDRFRILFVCTGNRFRSPLAAALLCRLTDGLPVVVGSAGTVDVGAAPALREAVRLGKHLGISLAEHHARQLTEQDVHGNDLLLGFEQAHLSHAIVDLGAPRERLFLFAEFAHALAAIEPVAGKLELPLRARERVRRVAERRRDIVTIHGMELEDPIGRPRGIGRRTAVEIEALSFELARGLFDVRSTDDVPLERRLRPP